MHNDSRRNTYEAAGEESVKGHENDQARYGIDGYEAE